MAYVMDPSQQNQTQTAPQQAPTSTGGAGIGGTAPAVAGQNVPAQPSAQLSAYLAANQPQAQALAGQVASNIAGQVGAANTAIGNASNAYISGLNPTPVSPDINTKVAAAPSSLTPGEISTFQGELAAQKNAPQSSATFETTTPYSDVVSQIQNAVQNAGLWNAGNNIPSISTALRPFESGTATTGDATLDALLLSQIPSAYGQITQATAPAANLQGNLAGQTQTADTALQNAIASDIATTQAANQAPGQFVSGLNTNLANYLSQAQKNATDYNAALNALSAQEAGVQPQVAALQNAVNAFNTATPQGARITPLALGNPLAPNAIGAPNIEQVATPQNYADLAALESLIGPGAFGALNPVVNPQEANLSGVPAVPAAPTFAAATQPIFPNLGQAGGVINNLNNPGEYPQLVSPYNDVVTAYNALAQATGNQLAVPLGSQAAPAGGTNVGGNAAPPYQSYVVPLTPPAPNGVPVTTPAPAPVIVPAPAPAPAPVGPVAGEPGGPAVQPLPNRYRVLGV